MRSRMLSSPKPVVCRSSCGSKPRPRSETDRQMHAEPPHPDAGLVDPGVLDHVEQQLLGGLVQEPLEGVRGHVDLAEGIDVDVQPVLGPHLAGQPTEVSAKSPWYSTAGLSSWDRLRDFWMASMSI